MEEQSLVAQERTPYQIMDLLDDNLIKAELENRIVDTWVYSFSADGRPQTGLSKVGVDACCTEMAKQGNVIREGEVIFKPDPIYPEYVLFQGIATRFLLTQDKEVKMEEVNGTKRQWTKMRLKSGKIIDDPFWFEKGAMKALRNARSRLIPEEIRTKIITLAKQKGRVKQVNDDNKNGTKQPEEPFQSPPEKTSDTMTDGQRKKIYAMLKEAGLNDSQIKHFTQENGIYKDQNPSKSTARDVIDNFESLVADYVPAG